MALSDLKLNSSLVAYLRNCDEAIKAGQVLPVPAPAPTVQRVRKQWRVRERLSAQDITDLVAGYVGGDSLYTLAKRYGINRTTVRRLLRERGVLE